MKNNFILISLNLLIGMCLIILLFFSYPHMNFKGSTGSLLGTTIECWNCRTIAYFPQRYKPNVAIIGLVFIYIGLLFFILPWAVKKMFHSLYCAVAVIQVVYSLIPIYGIWYMKKCNRSFLNEINHPEPEIQNQRNENPAELHDSQQIPEDNNSNLNDQNDVVNPYAVSNEITTRHTRIHRKSFDDSSLSHQNHDDIEPTSVFECSQNQKHITTYFDQQLNLSDNSISLGDHEFPIDSILFPIGNNSTPTNPYECVYSESVI